MTNKLLLAIGIGVSRCYFLLLLFYLIIIHSFACYETSRFVDLIDECSHVNTKNCQTLKKIKLNFNDSFVGFQLIEYSGCKNLNKCKQ